MYTAGCGCDVASLRIQSHDITSTPCSVHVPQYTYLHTVVKADSLRVAHECGMNLAPAVVVHVCHTSWNKLTHVYSCLFVCH